MSSKYCAKLPKTIYSREWCMMAWWRDHEMRCHKPKCRGVEACPINQGMGFELGSHLTGRNWPFEIRPRFRLAVRTAPRSVHLCKGEARLANPAPVHLQKVAWALQDEQLEIGSIPRERGNGVGINGVGKPCFKFLAVH